MKTQKIKHIALSTISIIVCSLLSTISLSEWYIVVIQKQTSDYPFGSEGPIPYYYKSAELYATVNVATGLISITLLAINIWALVRNKKVWSLYLFVATVVLTAIYLLQSYLPYQQILID
jgi:hypothetical protein